MTITIDAKLITRFRDAVNRKPIFRQLFANSDGKNKWNIICSAMDWIDVAAEGLPLFKIESPNFGHNSLASLNLMQYIVTVDILIESIQQLYRVICGENTNPLSQDSTIFKQSSISDDIYFKHIRAVFGTHPVNLTSVDGYNKQNGERFYSSWSAGKVAGSDADFNAVLYSNLPGKDDTFFGVKLDDVSKYAELRYNLLNDLINKVEVTLEEHLTLYRTKPIDSLTDPLKQLELLLKENNSRIGVRYGYSNEIPNIYDLLKVNITAVEGLDIDIIDEYKEFLLSLIPRIKLNLENMDIQLIEFWPKLGRGYEFRKIYEYLIENHSNKMGEVYFQDLVEKKWLPTFLFECNNFDEKYFLLNAYLHRAEKNGITKFGYGL
jgi:hypothetical protein